MNSAIAVREVEGLEAAAIAELLVGYPFDDYRRHRTIAPDQALAYLRERIAKALERPATWKLLASERGSGRPAGLLVLQHLVEDSALFGMRMAGIPFVIARADAVDARAVYHALLASLQYLIQREDLAHVSARLDSADLPGYQEFTDAGFRLVETLVSMAYDAERRGSGRVEPKEYGFDGIVRLVEPRDVEQIAALSAKAYTLNRYHLDDSLPKRDAGELMARWARSYCADARDCQVWVAEGPGGKIAGYLGHQLNRDLERHSGKLVSGRALLAVGDQRSRVGQLLSRAHTWQSKGDYKEADTQLNNYGMIKVAFNLDMDMVRTKYTFHRSFAGGGAGRRR
jgi:hypothetical protein